MSKGWTLELRVFPRTVFTTTAKTKTCARGGHIWGSSEKWAYITSAFSFLVFLKTAWLKINFLNCIVNCWSLISAKCDWNLGEKWTWAPPAGGQQSICPPLTLLQHFILQILHQVQHDFRSEVRSSSMKSKINNFSEVELVEEYPPSFLGSNESKLLRALSAPTEQLFFSPTPIFPSPPL